MAIRYGTSGDDVIVALSSTDTLVGLDGNDIFDFSSFSGVTVIEEAGGGTDTIRSTVGMVLPEFVENFILVGATSSLITGNALANRLEGGDGGDTLDGAGGPDTLVGGGGGDIYLIGDTRVVVIESVGAGADEVRTSVNYTLAANIEKGILDAGSTATTLTGNILANELVGNELANVLDGGAGNDTIEGDTGNDTLRGGDGNDSISGDAGNDSVDGGNGNDTLSGLAGDDRLTGGAGNDLLTGGTGRDTLVGGAGNDTYVLAAGDGTDVIVEAASGGIDTVRVDASLLSFTAATGIEAVIVSGADNFTLIGNAAANTLVGDTGADRIEGLAGNDAIDGGAGADTMIGGLGNDQYTVDNAGDQVIELAGLGSGNDRVFSAIADYTLTANVERLMLVAGSAAINGTGNALDNIIDGNEADNRLVGGAGNDRLDGHAGNDTLVGGIGNDTFVVDAPGDTIIELATGGTGDVVRITTDITYTMADGVESALVVAPQAHVIGNRSANLMTGGTGGDVLDGGRGIDTLVGGTGDDTYLVDNAGDTIVEGKGAGVDTVFATAAFTLPVNVEQLILVGSAGAISGTGSAGNDVITGNGSANLLAGLAGNDTLNGLGGDDTLQGGEGNDVLDGGTGVNTLDGGNGNDTYLVNSSSDAIADSGGHDLVIAEFRQSDLTGYTFFNGTVFQLIQIEDLQLAEGNSITNGFGNSLDNRITGNSQNNLLNGREGNDFIDGGAGNDTMIGGTGDDTFVVSGVGDRVTENALVGLVPGGSDTILSDLANYSLSILANFVGQQNLFVENLVYRGQSDATLTGNALNNRITGGAGNDSIDGGAGIDTMIGGAGNDTYKLDNLGDVVTEAAGGGNDKVIFGVANAGTVRTIDLNKTSSAGVIGLLNVENVTITITGTGLYNINGTAGDNVLIGNGSVNVITGGAGNDFIDGGGAADSMTGGAGNDTYVVNLGNGAIGGQVAGEDVINELANGGRDVVVLALNASAYTLPDFVEDLQGTVTSSAGLIFSGNAVDNAIDLTLANGGTINPGLGANDSVTVRGFASGNLTVTDADGTDFLDIVLSNVNGTGNIDARVGVDDVRFHLLSGSSVETVTFAANATVLVSGVGSLGLNVSSVANAYTLSDFSGTLTFGALLAAGLNDVLSLKLLDVQGGLATTNTAIDRIVLDSQGVVANSLAVGGVTFPGTSHPGFSVIGETSLDLTAIGNSGFEVGLNGYTGAQLGLAAQTAAAVQNWLVRTDGSATQLAITAGADANVLTVDSTGTGGASVLSIVGASPIGAIHLVGNQGLTLQGIAGGTVDSTMDGAGVVLRLGFDGATNFNVTSGKVDTAITGSGGGDQFLYGTSLDSNDAVDGGAGSDTLTATLAATSGNTTIVVAPTIASVESMVLSVLGNYVLDAAAMDASDVTVTGGGSTVLPISGDIFAFSFSVQNGRGTWDASGYNANNSFNFTAAADANGVTVTGGAGIGSIVGSTGDDVINPGTGNGGNVTGGAGSDTFVFSKAPLGSAGPTVTDYTVGVDHIELENAVMAAIGSPGALNPSLFSTFVSFDASTTDTQAGVLKYSTSDGTLYYDADGIRAGVIKEIGIFLKPDGTPAVLTAADITVI